MSDDFGSWLRNRRESLDVTRQQLADASGISWTKLSAIELGRKRVKGEQREIIIQTLRYQFNDRTLNERDIP